MMILNITTKVEKNTEQQWVEWMIDQCLHTLSKHSYIENSKLCILLIEDDEPTYVLQLFFKSAKDYKKIINEFAAQFSQNSNSYSAIIT